MNENVPCCTVADSAGAVRAEVTMMITIATGAYFQLINKL